MPELEPLPSSPQALPSPVRGTERTSPRSLARFLALALSLVSVLGTLMAFRWSEHPVKLRGAPSAHRRVAGPPPSDLSARPLGGRPAATLRGAGQCTAATREGARRSAKASTCGALDIDGREGEALTASISMAGTHRSDTTRGAVMRTSVLSLAAALALVACGDDFDMAPPLRNDVRCGFGRAVSRRMLLRIPGFGRLWEGWANEVASADCGSCECQPGSCLLAPTVAAQAPICADGAGPSIPFDAGDGWNGTCAAPAPAIPASAFGSVIYGPPALAPLSPSLPPDPPPITGTFARACKPILWVQPVDTALCITAEDDGSCAEGFRTRREFATQRVDNRTCTPCRMRRAERREVHCPCHALRGCHMRGRVRQLNAVKRRCATLS